MAYKYNELLSAVKYQNMGMFRICLEFHDDPNVRAGECGSTPLMAAAENGNMAMFKALLEAGAHIGDRDDCGVTPLMYAARRRHCILEPLARGGNPAIVEALLEAGAPVWDQADNGMTALMFAASADDHQSVRLLLAAGANPLKRDKDGQTARDHAEIQPGEVWDLLVSAERRWKYGHGDPHSLQSACAHTILRRVSEKDLPSLPLPKPLVKFLEGHSLFCFRGDCGPVYDLTHSSDSDSSRDTDSDPESDFFPNVDSDSDTD